MSWHEGEHCKEIPLDLINQNWEDMLGDFDVEQAERWLAKFLACNPYFAAEFLIGPSLGKIHPIQDILIRTWFQRDTNMLIASRGFSKSWTTAYFIVLFAIFNPECEIGIFSASFRQAKLLFESLEKFIEASEAVYLRQCVRIGAIKHSTDAHVMHIGKSRIRALPLTEKTRGMRFHLVIIDEYLSVPEKIVKEIIKPMLIVNKYNDDEKEMITKGEDILIAKGKMKEWQRTNFVGNKILMLSSASYKFETLYKDTYLNILETIHDKKAEDVSHSLFRMGWQCAPKGLLNKVKIEEARKTYSRQQFEREYCAIFTDDSGGFFNIRDIQNATVPPKEYPKIKLKGDKDLKYILAVDPNLSAGSDTADDFSMALLELAGNGTEIGTLVHSYAMPKSNIKNRAKYLEYLLNNFNIVLIFMDNAGGPTFLEFFQGLNEKFKTTLNKIDISFKTEEEFQQTKHLYNPSIGDKVVTQVFGEKNWIREANEFLQGDIQHKRIMFGSSIDFDDNEVVLQELNIDVEWEDFEFKHMDENIKGEWKKREFLDHVHERIENTKRELVMIQMFADASGHVRFDLPREMRQSVTVNKARRDSYTALLLANFARRCYFRLQNAPVVENDIYVGGWIT